MSPNFDRQFTKQIDKEVSGKKDMETLPFDREEVINAFLDYANAEKEYNKENGYSISSTPLSQSKEQQIAEDPDYKKVLEKEHEELVDKLYKNAQDLKKIFFVAAFLQILLKFIIINTFHGLPRKEMDTN